MFEFEIEDELEKKIQKLEKKNKVLYKIFKKKLKEIIQKDKESISTYKNLKKPLQEFKRIHLDDSFILLFRVNLKENKVYFYNILHRDKAYDS